MTTETSNIISKGATTEFVLKNFQELPISDYFSLDNGSLVESPEGIPEGQSYENYEYKITYIMNGTDEEHSLKMTSELLDEGGFDLYIIETLEDGTKKYIIEEKDYPFEKILKEYLKVDFRRTPLASLLASFDLDYTHLLETYEVAPEVPPRAFFVWITRHFYDKGFTRDDFARDYFDDIIEFDTFEDAQEFKEDLEVAIRNYPVHGQYSQDVASIVSLVDIF